LESNWRFNVWDLGMSFSGWRLAARVFEGADENYIVATSDLGPGRYGIYLYIPGEVPELLFNRPILPGAPHFPYNWDVLPD